MLLKKRTRRFVVEIARHDEQRHIRADTGRDVLQIADEPFKDIHGSRDPDIARPLGAVEPEPRPLPARKQHGGSHLALYDRLLSDGRKLCTARVDLLQGKPFDGLNFAASAVFSDMREGDRLPVYVCDLCGKLLSACLVQFIPPPQHMGLPVHIEQAFEFIVLHSFLQMYDFCIILTSKTISAYRFRHDSPNNNMAQASVHILPAQERGMYRAPAWSFPDMRVHGHGRHIPSVRPRRRPMTGSPQQASHRRCPPPLHKGQAARIPLLSCRTAHAHARWDIQSEALSRIQAKHASSRPR